MSFMSKSKGCGIWFILSNQLCSLLWGLRTSPYSGVALLLVLEMLRLECSWVLAPDGSSPPAVFTHFKLSRVKAISTNISFEPRLQQGEKTKH